MSDGLYDGRYVVRGYYDNAFMGLADIYGSDNWSEIEDKAHSFLSDGDYVEITDNVTGKSSRISPDAYFEDFNGEFPISYKLERDVM